jgi:dienelactone hydrolase
MRVSEVVNAGERFPPFSRGKVLRVSATGAEISIPLADGGALTSELFLPPASSSSSGPHPAVLVLHESFGLNDDIRRIARRFAEEGYVALAPDLFSHGSRIV